MRLSEDFLIPQYKKLTEIVHEKNCKIISQLALGAFYKNSVEISENELIDENIQEIIEKFISAAIRAEKANFDGVQIHAAHFFFLSRFISKIYNKNKNRAEILIKILRGIKKNTNFHVTIKINCSDFVDGGNDFDDSLKICEILAEKIKIPVICVGGWRSLAEMEKILRDTEIKFLSLSRPLIREPDLPKKFLKNQSKISKCVSCNACYSTPAHRCIFVK